MHLIKTGLIFIFSTLLFSSLSTQSYSKNLSPILTNGQTADNYAVKIFYDNEALRKKILVTFEPLDANKKNNFVIVEVDSAEHQKLLDAGLKVRIDKTFTQKMNSPAPRRPTLMGRAVSAAAGSQATIPGFSCYRTVEGTFSTAADIVNSYPNLASWSDVGNSWEKQNGLGGYDMKVLKLTNSAITTSKPALFITSSIHAREYAPAELITRFAEHLVSNYGTDADITWLLDYHEVHMMLMANPDGRKQAETGLSWRKNTNQNYCGTTSNTRGADLNRNFSFEWDCCNGSSANECSTTFHGAGPASEPETQAIQAYMTGLFGDHRGPGLNDAAPLDTSGIYLDIHSYSELILWPWGFTNSAAPNNMVSLGRKLAYSNNYTPQQAIGLYPTDGTTDDFAYGELGIPSYTHELGTAFFQDCGTFENTIIPDNFPSLLYALKAVRAPYKLPLGPDVVNLNLDLGDTSPVPAGTSVTLSASTSDTRYNNSNGTEPSQNISSAEYYIDTPPWVAGAVAVPISANDGTFNNPNEAITATINTFGLNEGKHTIFVQAKDANNNWGVVSAIFLNIDNNAVLPTILFEDNFETDLGWTSNASGTDTATTGKWERANPQATNSSGPKQLGTTVSGSFDLVTGATAGSSVGVNDIDNGVTSIRSPDIVVPAGGPFTLSFSYYLAHTSNSSTADFLRVSIIGNQNSVVLEELGAANDDDGVWEQFSANIDAFAGQTIHLLIEAADDSNGSIVEAGIDDLKIEGIVSGGNQSPTIIAPANQSNNEGDTVSLTVNASDPNGDNLTFSATNLPANMSINTSSGEISGVLSMASAGTYNVTVSASDGNLSDFANFSWTVNNVNQAPILTATSNQINNEAESVSLQLAASDPDGDPLTFNATNLPAGLSLNSSSGLISGTLTQSSSGNYNVTVTASDGTLTDSANFVWTVNNINQAPSITSPGNQSNVEGDSASITINASDPDGDTLSYSATGLPAGLSINSASGLISGTLGAGSTGNYNVTVSASDGSLSANTSFNWIISQVNVAPVIINPGNQVGDEGTSVSLQISASDANGDNLSFTASGLPSGLAINTSTGLVSGNLLFSSSGSYNVTITASDSTLTDSTNFVWTVNNVNQAPSLIAPGNQSNNEGDIVSLSASASDPDGDIISYSASGLPAGISIDTNTGSISGTLANGSNGNHVVTITASDGNLTDSASFNWLVNVVSTNWLETKLVSGVNSSSWTTVTLNHSYTSLVAVCTVNYQNNTIPEVVRMNNVTDNSFDIKLQNPGNSTLLGEDVHCIAMEEGSWTLADGRQIEAQTFNSTRTDRRGSWVGQTANYLGSYTTPVVVGQVMSYNDVNWSVFWSRGSSKRNPPSANTLFVGKQVSEDTNKTRNNETLGFIVMDAGTGTTGNIAYEARLGADTVRGLNTSPISYTYSQNFTATPLVGIATQTAMDGGNGSWAVLRGASPLAGGGITLGVDEDQIRDSERSHTTEQVMIMVFQAQTDLQLNTNP